MADSKSDSPKAKPAAEKFPNNPHGNNDPNIDDGYENLDPTKVIGTYAEQPDPNADRPAPQPVVPPGVHKAPKADDEGAPAKLP